MNITENISNIRKAFPVAGLKCKLLLTCHAYAVSRYIYDIKGILANPDFIAILKQISAFWRVEGFLGINYVSPDI